MRRGDCEGFMVVGETATCLGAVMLNWDTRSTKYSIGLTTVIIVWPVISLIFLMNRIQLHVSEEQ